MPRSPVASLLLLALGCSSTTVTPDAAPPRPDATPATKPTGPKKPPGGKKPPGDKPPPDIGFLPSGS